MVCKVLDQLLQPKTVPVKLHLPWQVPTQ